MTSLFPWPTRALGAVLLLTLAAGCITKSTTSPDDEPDEPDPAGRIEFAATPGTIQWLGQGANVCPNPTQAAAYGPYSWVLRETGGGTVTITSFSVVTTATNGPVTLNNDQLIQLLAQDLTGTAAASITVNPNQQLTGPPRYSCQPSPAGSAGFPVFPQGASSVQTVSGTDSNGTPVTATFTLTLEGL